MIDPQFQSELRAKFNPDNSLIRQHQLRMLEMLKYIDEKCREHNIKYWLSSGTCLGAVRHGGFIPWDDDVDIEILKSDYPRFKKMMDEDSSTNLAFQTHDSDSEYFAPYGKIRDLNSIIEEGNCHDRYYKYRGVYIDVFLIEPSVSRIIARVSGGLQNRLQYPLSKIQNRTLRKIATNGMYLFLSKLVYPILSFITCHRTASQRLRHIHGSGFVKPRYYNDLFPLIDMTFEGILFPVPNNYHHYLSTIYGDYMKIPDLSKIKTHLSKVVLNQ